LEKEIEKLHSRFDNTNMILMEVLKAFDKMKGINDEK
jgi:hypothetical protein